MLWNFLERWNMRAWIEEAAKDRGGALRLLLIGVLTLALLIPLGMVDALIEERGGRRQVVLDEIAAQQGGEQRIVGPVMIVPYTRQILIETSVGDNEIKTKPKAIGGVAIILPEALSSTAELKHSIRKRGLYEAPVYKAPLRLKARFGKADLAAAIPDLLDVDWSKAAVAISVSDISGLSGVDRFTLDGQAAAPVATRLGHYGSRIGRFSP